MARLQISIYHYGLESTESNRHGRAALTRALCAIAKDNLGVKEPVKVHYSTEDAPADCPMKKEGDIVAVVDVHDDNDTWQRLILKLSAELFAACITRHTARTCSISVRRRVAEEVTHHSGDPGTGLLSAPQQS